MMCGNPEMLGDGTPALKLFSNRPLVLIQSVPPGQTKDGVWAWLKEAHARWSAVCDWLAERISDMSEAGPGDAVHLVTAADLGGGGVLADQMLPYTGGKILKMRLNTRIRWQVTDGGMSGGAVDPIRTICHEIGHLMGHSHWPTGAPPELMEPYVSNTIIKPQPTEGKVSAGWFGLPSAEPVPVPVPTHKDLVIRVTNGVPSIDGWRVLPLNP